MMMLEAIRNLVSRCWALHYGAYRRYFKKTVVEELTYSNRSESTLIRAGI